VGGLRGWQLIQHLCWLGWRYREQARSHRGCGELIGIIWPAEVAGLSLRGIFSIDGGWAGAIASKLAPTGIRCTFSIDVG
jgi:hypothetical protein